MSNRHKIDAVLIAEDDDEDFFLTQKALHAVHWRRPLCRVKDGEELMDFLLRRGDVEEGTTKLLILLDLNMPRKDGRDALREIKSHPVLKRVPVVVLTTSRAPGDVAVSYALGANSFIQKPLDFPKLVEAMGTLKKYWLETVELPGIEKGTCYERKGHKGVAYR